MIWLTRIETPLGTMIACADATCICLLKFADQFDKHELIQSISNRFGQEICEEKNSHLSLLNEQLNRYFKGRQQEYTLPLVLKGSLFQVKVWEQLQKIPYGTTSTYAHQANALGKPDAIRAVANANASNDIYILVPCHRVVGSDGKLTGYGGGLWRKQYLLELESKTTQFKLAF
jgi:AraC family transcriptional regulator of adaptative response/methylated-DNA-[protein]-cysteine methyltransferase